MRLIGLNGEARSGKDTVGRMIQAAMPGAASIAFAEPLKRFLKEVCDPRYPRPPEPFHAETSATFLTPRYAMQRLGTEFGRRCYDGVWVDHAMRRVRFLLGVDPFGFDVHNGGNAPLAVITDCRFINEAKAIRAAGGVVWRIVRPGAGAQGGISGHASEAEMASPEFLAQIDATLQNDSTLDALRGGVVSLLGRQMKDWEGR